VAEDAGENEDLGRGTLIKIHLKPEAMVGGGWGPFFGGGRVLLGWGGERGPGLARPAGEWGLNG
jgi:hypothetical protein